MHNHKSCINLKKLKVQNTAYIFQKKKEENFMLEPETLTTIAQSVAVQLRGTLRDI